LKQVKIEGDAKLVADKDADEYFNSRLENSRIGTWASDQSSELNSREELENSFQTYPSHEVHLVN
ncbi:MAG: hypothetical protein CMP12_11515, partial [Zunongwangia sp.]|nr:hypothetical protein [Zunongwangia sp.]